MIRWDSFVCMLDEGCRLAFVSCLTKVSYFFFFFAESPYKVDMKLIHWDKHHGTSESNLTRGSNSHPGWKCYPELNHILLFDLSWYHSDTLEVNSSLHIFVGIHCWQCDMSWNTCVASVV